MLNGKRDDTESFPTTTWTWTWTEAQHPAAATKENVVMSRPAWVVLRPSVVPLFYPPRPVLCCSARPYATRRRSPTKSRPRSRPPRCDMMKVAVVGCAHGELDLIYAALHEIERAHSITADLLICAGDFQAVRNSSDLQCMSVPPKFRDMRTFWRYYAGHAHAPVPTIFVGGNHEASNHLQEIPLGGLVAPNMYFLGNAGVVNYRGLRLAGVSGVYTEHNYEKKRTERPPYPRNQIKSVYHTRKEDVDRLLRLSGDVDVFVSHDWPRGISGHGRLDELLKSKPFLRGEIANDTFGNPGATQLLHKLQPKFWFAAHIHVKFAALVRHDDTGKETRFLALDKALPKRDFIQILDIPVDAERGDGGVSFADRRAFEEAMDADEFRIDLDPEWLTILRTEGQQPGRETPATETEIRSTVAAMKAKGVKSFVLPVSDFERLGQPHDAKAPNQHAPTQVALQESNIKILDALQMPKDAWIAKEQAVAGEQQVATVPAST